MELGHLALAALAGALPFGAMWWRARRLARADRAVREGLIQAMEATPCNFALFDAERHLVACNAAYRDLHRAGFDATPPGRRVRYDDLMREACRRTLPPERVEAELAQRVANHEACSDEGFERLYPDGRWMRVHKRRLSSGCVAGFALDITPLKQREAEIEASEARFRAMVDSAPVGIWQLDESGRTLFSNDVLARIFDSAAPGGVGESGLALGGGDDAASPFGLAPGQRTELDLPRPDGTRRTLLAAASPWLPNPAGGRMALLSLLDITSLKRAQAQVEHLARHDPLTGLGNREAFRLALSAMIEAGGGALVLLDLDRFKEANDRHGHEAGDALLMTIADRLRGAARLTDAVCRLGGDEFAIVMPGANAEAARAVAARAARLAAEPVAFRRVELRVGASAGVAVAPADGEDADSLARAADLALYQSKSERRGEPRLFTPNLRRQADQRLLLREALAAAIPAGELRLVFQPQRDLGNHALIGAEALLRWRSTRLGREVSPGELFPAAAEALLLPAIDEWVMGEAVARLASWVGNPAAPPVLSINLSVAALRDPSVADGLARRLLAARVDPGRLEIEVPEGLAIRDIEAVRPTLERVNSVGVRLALDDFGAGLSSLQHVVGLPVDRLKLDRSVISALGGPAAAPRAVLRATLALARGMGIEVLAEGVETEAQAFALRREGITAAQGWLTGRPVPEAELLGAVAARAALRAAAAE